MMSSPVSYTALSMLKDALKISARKNFSLSTSELFCKIKKFHCLPTCIFPV